MRLTTRSARDRLPAALTRSRHSRLNPHNDVGAELRNRAIVVLRIILGDTASSRGAQRRSDPETACVGPGLLRFARNDEAPCVTFLRQRVLERVPQPKPSGCAEHAV